MFDITNPIRMHDYIKRSFKKITTIIHCAALTDVTYCEKRPLEAYEVNSLGTHYLADLCNEFKIKLVYISTDHVFDGEKGNYTEEDIPNPIGHYAKSKLIGEWFTLSNPNNLVIRTSFMKDFPFDKAYIDKYWSGERIEAIANWIANAVEMNIKGLIHISGFRKSIYDFVKTFKPEVKPMKLEDRPTNPYGLKYLKDTSLNIKTWEDTCYLDT